jgi:Fic-DOC domain mobile mystery protein B
MALKPEDRFSAPPKGWVRAIRDALDMTGVHGIAPHLIAAEVPTMLDHVRYRVEHNRYPPGEIAARLHHRLTQIHAFPNGDGRHARMMADLVIERLGGRGVSWGGGSLADVGTLRNQYVAALKAADNHDIGPLLAFMRS